MPYGLTLTPLMNIYLQIPNIISFISYLRKHIFNSLFYRNIQTEIYIVSVVMKILCL